MAKKIFLILVLAAAVMNVSAADMPQLSADAGPCWAEFTVTDAAGKPAYLAKIHTVVRYGFMSKRKTELDLQTDTSGKGKFTGLPHEVKKPIEFDITYKDTSKTVTHDPATNCHALLEVKLENRR